MRKNNSKLIKLSPLVLLISSCFIFFFIYKYKSENPKIEWNTSAENVVISYQYFGEIDYGYIPDFRVWGDGYIVWVEKDDFSRNVYEGYLSQTELHKLLEQFVDAGFYNWFNDTDFSIYVGINLLTGYKQKSIDANEKISQLVNYLLSGAGVEAKEFIPTIGYFYVFPIEKTAYFNYEVIPYQWPQEKFKVNFNFFEDTFPNGKAITGHELAYVWKIVNNSPFIESNGKIYWIALTIPKITD